MGPVSREALNGPSSRRRCQPYADHLFDMQIARISSAPCRSSVRSFVTATAIAIARHTNGTLVLSLILFF